MRRLALLAPLLAGCLSGEYTSRRNLQEPPAHFGLVPGKDDLSACLDVLGAPLQVYENGEGAVLAWGWSEDRVWGLTMSIPMGSQRGSFTYQRGATGLEGLVLVFDEAWLLTSIKEGSLADVLPSSQTRARVVD